LISRAKDRGIGVLIRSGFGGGWLTSRITSAPRESARQARTHCWICGGDAMTLYSQRCISRAT
jgi:aryl-alcohol dehydrogenase-like predicted oxidoreductase